MRRLDEFRGSELLFRRPLTHRQRWRLYRRTAAATVILVAGVLFVFFRNTGHPFHARVLTKPPTRLHTPKTVLASPEDRAEAEGTLDRFVRTAVIRRNAEDAWDLATPQMHGNATRADWERGELPVVPYPAADFRTAGATLEYSYSGILGYDVLVLPKSSSGSQRVYACELHELDGHWLVDWCYPRATL